MGGIVALGAAAVLLAAAAYADTVADGFAGLIATWRDLFGRGQ